MPDTTPNCAIARQLYDAFLAGNIEGILALLHPEIEWELVGSEVPHFGCYRGIEEVKRFFSIVGDINRVESFEVVSITETMKGAYAECIERGHFAGHPMGFELRSCQLMEMADGLITHFRIYQDTAKMVDAWRS